MKKGFLFFLLLVASLYAEVMVYGPGGPAPVLQKLAKEFNAPNSEKIIIQAGPTSSWIEEAKMKADIIFAGNSSMMDTFVTSLGNKIDPAQIQVLNMRQAGIIVRPNNPKKIKAFKDLLKSGIKVMVVNGAGQVGLYEDMALKNGKRSNLCCDIQTSSRIMGSRSKH